jgi:hypothetical protein
MENLRERDPTNRLPKIQDALRSEKVFIKITEQR